MRVYPMPTDAELLQRYAGQHDERAFAELVQRHLGLVYATAHRSTGSRPHLAEEIAQKVFTQLARKAASLSHHPTLTGWLYRSARYASLEVSRAELRRQRINQSLATMPDTTSMESPGDWEQLRPVLDEAMERLKESDREIMLLRFFQGLTFAEVGAKLELTENAARMRTERALDKLRGHLRARGVTSSAAALGLLLANQAFAAAPAGLAANVTTTALAAAPAGAFATFVTTLLLNKMAAAVFSAVLAAGITAMAWASLPDELSESELAALRAEYASLDHAAATGAPPVATNSEADGTVSSGATIVETVGKEFVTKNAAGIGRYRNQGQATPNAALLSYAWAIDTGDVAALAKILTYDAKARESIRAIHARMPAEIRSQYSTPEELIAFFFVADSLLSPVPGPDVLENYRATEIGSGRTALGYPENPGRLEFILEGDEWRCVVPEAYPEILAKRILDSQALAKLGQK